MNKKSKLFITILVISFMLILPLMFGTTIYAEENEEFVRDRILLIEADVDPRVSAANHSVTLMFKCERTGTLEIVTLTDASGYLARVPIYASEFTLFSGMVHNDLVGDYIVECSDFNTFKSTTTIRVVIGNPNYGGPVVDKPDNILGFIDREATDQLRKEHGLPPIDWAEVDRYTEENLEKVPEFFETINEYLKQEEERDKEKEEYYKEQEKLEQESQPTPTDPDTTTDPSNPTDPNNPNETGPTDSTQPTTPEKNNQTEKEKSTNFAIWFVIIAIAIIAIVLYLRHKNNYFAE